MGLLTADRGGRPTMLVQHKPVIKIGNQIVARRFGDFFLMLMNEQSFEDFQPLDGVD